MIKIVVSNMSCGHCRLKINSELESKGYDVKDIDMDHNIITINTSINKLQDIIKLLNSINYMVDLEATPGDIKQYKIQSNMIEDDDCLDKIIKKLSELNIKDYDIDFEKDILEIVCSDGEATTLKELIDDFSS